MGDRASAQLKTTTKRAPNQWFGLEQNQYNIVVLHRSDIPIDTN